MSTTTVSSSLFRFPSSSFLAALAVSFVLTSGVVRAQDKVIYSPTGDQEVSPFVTASDASGNLYGATFFGGTGCGSVFELSFENGGWAEKDLHVSACSPDGVEPWGVIRDEAGNLYGVAHYGGAHNRSSCIAGCGTVFELSPDGNGGWTQTLIYSFTGGADGGNPVGDLVFDKAGNLYGVTFSGGAISNSGVAFELSPSNGAWTQTVIHTFGTGSDGAFPNGTLAIDQFGSLYGTTGTGGTQKLGTAFKLALSGGTWQETILRNFGPATPDGNSPFGGVILDSAGNVYGTSSAGAGGCFRSGCGAVWELTPSANGWSEHILYRFSGPPNASNPDFPLTMDAAGNLYGTGGGARGAVFKLIHTSTGWEETVLHSFTGAPNDGYQPDSGVIFGKDGLLYGGTDFGGNATCTHSSAGGCGVVYELKP